MADIKVVGLGMAVLDILIRLKEMPTWDKGARLSAMAIEGGGPVATAIVAVQRLGVLAGFIGTVGSDRMGQIKLQTLVENGVEVSHIVRRDRPENQVVLVSVHQETGERVFSGLNAFRGEPIQVEELDRNYITSAEWLHLDGMHSDAALHAARWMHQAGKKVMLDGSSTRGPVSAEMRALVEQADVLICGSGFGPALTGFGGTPSTGGTLSATDLWKIGEEILQMGPRIMVQTEGREGSYTVTPTERFHTPIIDVDVVDTTGAGDVFHGAYIVGLMQGWDARKTALFSTAVSAIKCTRLGGRPGIPSFDQTIRFLRERRFDF